MCFDVGFDICIIGIGVYSVVLDAWFYVGVGAYSELVDIINLLVMMNDDTGLQPVLNVVFIPASVQYIETNRDNRQTNMTKEINHLLEYKTPVLPLRGRAWHLLYAPFIPIHSQI